MLLERRSTVVRVELRRLLLELLPNVRLLTLVDCWLLRLPNVELLLRLYIGSLCCVARLPNERLLELLLCVLERPPNDGVAVLRFTLERLLSRPL